MTYLFHIFLCLALVIFQTAVKPQVVFLAGLYDVLAAYIIYLGLYHRVREILPIILISGVVMDTISGGPPGLFLTTYVWLFLLTRWTTRILHRETWCCVSSSWQSALSSRPAFISARRCCWGRPPFSQPRR